ncbi:MAG: hypothetical protein EHM45_24045, partial [Desulfobacteraceae bacterium]
MPAKNPLKRTRMMPIIKKKMIFQQVGRVGLVLLLSGSFNAYGEWYTLKPGVKLRSGPGIQQSVIQTLEHNQTVRVMSKKETWFELETLTGQKGYVREDLISNLWIKVHKKERTLFLMRDKQILKSYKVALSTQNPLGDKIRQGDSGTPEGRFFICEMLKKPGEPRYGARSLRLSYPTIEDARRGLKNNIVNYDQYLFILKQIKEAQMPLQNTKLGGSIRIHGGG